MLRVLTWNIAADDVSVAAPATWSVRDKMLSLRAEIGRLRPDVLALQEASGFGISAAAPLDFDLVGSSQSHRGFVQLYCRRGLGMRRVRLAHKFAAVAGVCDVGGVEVLFVSAHLTHGEDAAELRAQQLR